MIEMMNKIPLMLKISMFITNLLVKDRLIPLALSISFKLMILSIIFKFNFRRVTAYGKIEGSQCT